MVDGLNIIRARELCLERTTRANDDYQKQIAQLAKNWKVSPLAIIEHSIIPELVSN
jgi:hypothetical protein